MNHATKNYFSLKFICCQVENVLDFIYDLVIIFLGLQLKLILILMQVFKSIHDYIISSINEVFDFDIDFSEAMRSLGFPQLISLESFRSPNWPLVESCSRWLAARVEPDALLAGGADTLEQRVALVTHATELFVSLDNCNV